MGPTNSVLILARHFLKEDSDKRPRKSMLAAQWSTHICPYAVYRASQIWCVFVHGVTVPARRNSFFARMAKRSLKNRSSYIHGALLVALYFISPRKYNPQVNRVHTYSQHRLHNYIPFVHFRNSFMNLKFIKSLC